jgi:hypothetical protein
MLAGCVGDDGGAPTAPETFGASRTLTVVSGRTGEPVAAATVVLAGHSYRTDGNGRIVLSEAPPADLDVLAPQHLVRETRLSASTGGEVVLWPLGPGYAADYVRSLLYKPSHTTREGPSAAPDEPLHRLLVPRVSVVPAAGLRSDRHFLEALDEAIAELNRVTEGVVSFGIDPRPLSDVTFRIDVDPGISSAALAWRDLRAFAVVGGRIAFKSLASARDPRYLTHELGHALGLEHSTVSSDMMYFLAVRPSPRGFSENERLTIRLLLRRRPGNRFPDNDRDGSAAASSASATCVVED